jgi:hypothetical protein
MGGQIVDATVIEARRPRLTQVEKDTLKGGGTPADWKPVRRAQIDRDGRWTLKRGRKRELSALRDQFETSLNSDAKCNTPGRFDIGKVDQDLEECCHAILRALVVGGERPTWDLARCWALTGGNLQGAGPG